MKLSLGVIGLWGVKETGEIEFYGIVGLFFRKSKRSDVFQTLKFFMFSKCLSLDQIPSLFMKRARAINGTSSGSMLPMIV